MRCCCSQKGKQLKVRRPELSQTQSGAFRDRAVSTQYRAILGDQDLFVWRGIDRLCGGPWDGQLEQHSGQKNLRQFIKRSFIK